MIILYNRLGILRSRLDKNQNTHYNPLGKYLSNYQHNFRYSQNNSRYILQNPAMPHIPQVRYANQNQSLIKNFLSL